MPASFAAFDSKLFINPRHAGRGDAYAESLQAIISLASSAEASKIITQWPGYEPTPLFSLPGLAKAAGVGAIYYKHEANRFGLGSFKALGGSYAVYRWLESVIKAKTGVANISVHDLLAGKYRAITEMLTVTTATDGNHGRAVAWGAKVFGCKCVVYIHAHVSEGRKKAIEAYGAEVIRITGNYDDSVRRAQADADTYGRTVISDTTYPGYMDIPRWVMQGYGLMVEEAFAKIPAGVRPTHCLVQGGVGALPAAICGYLWEALGKGRPHFTVVEPERADCLYQSAIAGEPRHATGDLNTIMAGLACGEVSLLAWDILQPGADAFMLVPDAAAAESMRILARGTAGDEKIVAGESAVGGMAGLLSACAHPEQKRALGLDASSTVLLFGTEGATDPVIYEKIVGKSPQAIET